MSRHGCYYFLVLTCLKGGTDLWAIKPSSSNNITVSIHSLVISIDADACIDCGACEATCPNEAITEA